jgi:hypothetical protein
VRLSGGYYIVILRFSEMLRCLTPFPIDRQMSEMTQANEPLTVRHQQRLE